jgi:hypothetical protein
MKISLLSIASVLLFHHPCFDQTLLHESSLKLTKKAQIKVSANINNDIYFSILDVSALHRFYLNTSTGSLQTLIQPINENSLPWEDHSVIMYSFSEKGKTINVVHDDFSKRIYAEVVDFNKKGIRAITHLALKKEMLIGAAVIGETFYLISHHKETNDLRFFIRTPDGTFFARDFDLSYFNPPGEIKLPAETWSKCKVIENTSLEDPEVLAARIKIYITPESIRITADNYYHYTRIMEISLPDYHVKKEEHSQMRLNSKTLYTPLTSSALWRNCLAQAVAYPDTLKIRFIELTEKKVIKEFGTNKDDTISFKNSPIYQEGGGTIFSSTREIELKKTSQLLRKISGGELAMGVSDIQNSKVEMIIGSFKEVVSPSGFGVGFSQWGMSLGYGNFTKWGKSSYFRSILNAQSLEHLPEVSITNINELTKNENPFPKAEKRIDFTSRNRRITVVYEGEKLSVYSSENFTKK